MADERSKGNVDSRPGALSLERYAEVLAHIRFFGSDATQQILVRLEVPPNQWTTEGDAFVVAIVAEAEAEQGTDLAVRFGAVYAPTLARLRKEKPRLEQIGQASENSAAAESPSDTAEKFRIPGLAAEQMSAWHLSNEAAARSGRAVREPDQPALTRSLDDTTIEQFPSNTAPALPFGVNPSTEYVTALVTPRGAPKVDARPVDDPVESTTELPGGVLGPATPFETPVATQPNTPEIDVDDLDATRELSRDGQALGLAAKPPPSREKRLIRFDPQTGKPLPEPVWVEVPETGSDAHKK